MFNFFKKRPNDGIKSTKENSKPKPTTKDIDKELGDDKREAVKNGITELVFILDKSGSMSGLEKDTIGGFNSMIEKQKKLDGKVFVSTVLFNQEATVIHDRIDINEVEKMTEDDYCVSGCTALVDAFANAIHHINNIHKYARNEDVPEHTIFIVTTDGQENASHEYSAQDLRKMVEKKTKQGWEFLFLGANIDAVSTASSYGIKEQNAVNYHADERGTSVMYKNVSKAVGMCRSCSEISADWKEDIQADFECRASNR